MALVHNVQVGPVGQPKQVEQPKPVKETTEVQAPVGDVTAVDLTKRASEVLKAQKAGLLCSQFYKRGEKQEGKVVVFTSHTTDNLLSQVAKATHTRADGTTTFSPAKAKALLTTSSGIPSLVQQEQVTATTTGSKTTYKVAVDTDFGTSCTKFLDALVPILLANPQMDSIRDDVTQLLEKAKGQEGKAKDKTMITAMAKLRDTLKEAGFTQSSELVRILTKAVIAQKALSQQDMEVLTLRMLYTNSDMAALLDQLGTERGEAYSTPSEFVRAFRNATEGKGLFDKRTDYEVKSKEKHKEEIKAKTRDAELQSIPKKFHKSGVQIKIEAALESKEEVFIITLPGADPVQCKPEDVDTVLLHLLTKTGVDYLKDQDGNHYYLTQTDTPHPQLNKHTGPLNDLLVELSGPGETKWALSLTKFPGEGQEEPTTKVAVRTVKKPTPELQQAAPVQRPAQAQRLVLPRCRTGGGFTTFQKVLGVGFAVLCLAGVSDAFKTQPNGSQVTTYTGPQQTPVPTHLMVRRDESCPSSPSSCTYDHATPQQIQTAADFIEGDGNAITDCWDSLSGTNVQKLNILASNLSFRGQIADPLGGNLPCQEAGTTTTPGATGGSTPVVTTTTPGPTTPTTPGSTTTPGLTLAQIVAQQGAQIATLQQELQAANTRINTCEARLTQEIQDRATGDGQLQQGINTNGQGIGTLTGDLASQRTRLTLAEQEASRAAQNAQDAVRTADTVNGTVVGLQGDVGVLQTGVLDLRTNVSDLDQHQRRTEERVGVAEVVADKAQKDAESADKTAYYKAGGVGGVLGGVIGIGYHIRTRALRAQVQTQLRVIQMSLIQRKWALGTDQLLQLAALRSNKHEVPGLPIPSPQVKAVLDALFLDQDEISLDGVNASVTALHTMGDGEEPKAQLLELIGALGNDNNHLKEALQELCTRQQLQTHTAAVTPKGRLTDKEQGQLTAITTLLQGSSWTGNYGRPAFYSGVFNPVTHSCGEHYLGNADFQDATRGIQKTLGLTQTGNFGTAGRNLDQLTQIQLGELRAYTIPVRGALSHYQRDAYEAWAGDNPV